MVKQGKVGFTHYYPFGMEFIKYDDISGVPSKEKYTGKELQADFGLNLYDYGWRNYDMATGRFTAIDPMAEKYYAISPYAWCMGNPVNAIDPDGKAPGDVFTTRNAAAIDFGKLYNDNSIRNNREYGATIYEIRNAGNNIGYTYSIPNKGNTGSSVTPSSEPEESTAVAFIHSHAAYSNGAADDNNFSWATRKSDIAYARHYNIDGYVTTPNGSLQRYDIKTNTIYKVSTQMPSDARDPSRLNKIDSAPTTTTYTVKDGDSLVGIAKIFDTSAAAIIKENNLETNIQLEQKLKITN